MNTPNLILPTLDETFALCVDAARWACAHKRKWNNSLPWGCTKQAALYAEGKNPGAGTAHVAYKQHQKNWTQLVKAERIRLWEKNRLGAFYLPAFVVKDLADGTYTLDPEAFERFLDGATQ